MPGCTTAIVASSYQYPSETPPVILELSMDALPFADSGPNNLPVTLSSVNAVDLDTTIRRVGNGSALFSGKGWMIVSSTPTQSLTFTGPFTIHGWVRGTGTGPYGTHCIFALGHHQNGNGLVFRIDGSNIQLFYNNNAIANGTLHSVPGASVYFPKNEWCYFAVTRDDQNVLRLYSARDDGTAAQLLMTVAASELTNLFNTTNLPLLIGTTPHNTTQQWRGYIDDFAIVRGYPTNFNIVPFSITHVP